MMLSFVDDFQLSIEYTVWLTAYDVWVIGMNPINEPIISYFHTARPACNDWFIKEQGTAHGY